VDEVQFIADPVLELSGAAVREESPPPLGN
jgi:hypothetical protein